MSREPVPVNTWIVDHDAVGFPDHVTIAVCNSNGLLAVDEDGRKFHIPELSNMNWELTSTMYVCEGGVVITSLTALDGKMLLRHLN